LLLTSHCVHATYYMLTFTYYILHCCCLPCCCCYCWLQVHFWYAAGAVLQIMLFGIMAVLIKRRAPNAHTILEVVRVRWGTAAHLVYL